MSTATHERPMGTFQPLMIAGPAVKNTGEVEKAYGKKRYQRFW